MTPEKRFPIFLRGVLGLWAGVSIGGALVAVPAKFQAASLTRAVALEVGRAQFHWLGVVEAVLCTVVLLGLLLRAKFSWHWPGLALAIFVIQWAVIMPPLDARTLQVIAGQELPPSSLHVVYVIAEVAKFLVLSLLAVGVLPRSKAGSARTG